MMDTKKTLEKQGSPSPEKTDERPLSREQIQRMLQISGQDSQFEEDQNLDIIKIKTNRRQCRVLTTEGNTPEKARRGSPGGQKLMATQPIDYSSFLKQQERNQSREHKTAKQVSKRATQMNESITKSLSQSGWAKIKTQFSKLRDSFEQTDAADPKYQNIRVQDLVPRGHTAREDAAKEKMRQTQRYQKMPFSHFSPETRAKLKLKS